MLCGLVMYFIIVTDGSVMTGHVRTNTATVEKLIASYKRVYGADLKSYYIHKLDKEVNCETGK